MKTLFIYNPHAGKMQIKNHLFDILNVLAKENYDLTVIPTKKRHEATAYLANNLQNYDYVICSGGDGTLNEVVNGFLLADCEKFPPIGYIPAGSTNDYAISLNIPKNMVEAAKFVTTGEIHKYDIGKFNSRFFIYIAAFGAFTAIPYTTKQEIKNSIGHLAYMLGGLKSLTSIKANKMKIKANNKVIEGSFIYGMITNTYSIGGIYNIDREQAKLDDGLFEVLLIKEPHDLNEINEITSFFLGAGTLGTDFVITFKTNKLTIESEEKVPWTLDGEYGGSPSKVNFRVINKAIKVVSKQ